MEYKLTYRPNKYCKSTILYTEKYLKINYKFCSPGKGFCQTVQDGSLSVIYLDCLYPAEAILRRLTCSQIKA